MAVLTRFCFCCGLRAGCMFVATYSLLSSAFFIALLLIRNIGFRLVELSITHAVVTYGSFVLFGLLMLVSVGLIIGVHRESRWMFIPWLVQTLVALLFATGTIVWLIVTIIRSEDVIESWEIALVAFHSINLVCSSYCMLCVISLFQDLSKRAPSTRPTRRERRANRANAENGAVNQGATASNGVPRPPSMSVVSPPPYAATPPPYTTFPRGAPQLASGQRSATRPRSGAGEATPDEDDLPPYSTFPRGVPDQLVSPGDRARATRRQAEPGEEDLGEAPPYSTFPRGVPELLAQSMENRPSSIHPPPLIEEEEEEEEEEEGEELDEEVVPEPEVGEEEDEHHEEEVEDLQEQPEGDVPTSSAVGPTVEDEPEIRDGPPRPESPDQDVLLVPELGTASYSGRSSGSSVSAIQIIPDNPFGGPLENDLQPLLPAPSDGDTDTDVGRSGDEDPVTAIYSSPLKKLTPETTGETSSNTNGTVSHESVMPPESPYSEPPPPIPKKLFVEAESEVPLAPVSQSPETPIASPDLAKEHQKEVAKVQPLSPPPTLGPASSRREAEIREIKQRLRAALPREQQDPVVPQQKQQRPKSADASQHQMASSSSINTEKATAGLVVPGVNVRDSRGRSGPVAPTSSHTPQQHSPHAHRSGVEQQPSPSKVSNHPRPTTSTRTDSQSISATVLSPAIKAQLEVVLDRGRRIKESNMRDKDPSVLTRSGPLSAGSNMNWERYNVEQQSRIRKQPSVVSNAGVPPKAPETLIPSHPRDIQERLRTVDNQHLIAGGSQDSGDPRRGPQQQERPQRGLLRPRPEGADHVPYNTDPLGHGQDASPGARRQNDSRDERNHDGRFLKPPGKNRERPRLDERDRFRPDERDRPRPEERDRLRPEERDRVRPEERDRLRPEERDRPRPEERDRLRPEERDRIRPEERDRLRPEERDRPRPEERDRPRPDDRDRLRPEERDRLRPEERDRPRPDDRDRPRPEERDRLRPEERDRLRPEERDRLRPEDRDRLRLDERLRQNERERPRLDEKDRMRHDDRDKAWLEDRDLSHSNGTAHNVPRQMQPPEYIPHAKRLSRENNDPYWDNWKYAGNRGGGGSPRPHMNSKHRGKRRGHSDRQEGDSKYHL